MLLSEFTILAFFAVDVAINIYFVFNSANFIIIPVVVVVVVGVVVVVVVEL